MLYNCRFCGVKTFSNVKLLVIDGPLKPTEIISFASTIADEHGKVPSVVITKLLKTYDGTGVTLRAHN